MRVALLPSAYAPAVGGVEVLTARLAHHLALRGHEVEVWTSRSHNDELPSDERIDDVVVRRFVFTMPRMAAGSLVRFPFEATSTLRQMRRAARAFRPHVLHVQCFSGNGAYATALSSLSSTPLVVTLQGETVMDDHDIYDHSVALRQALRVGLRSAHAVTACSDFTLTDARARFGLAPSKGRVIFNGVDEEAAEEPSLEVPFDRYVLALGRVVRKKGFDLLLEAFARVAPNHPDVGLVIAGDGPELASLRAMAADLGLTDRVGLPGRVGRGGVAAMMRRAEVFVMPSRVEPFGIVALEAWRAGVPVVVTSRGGAAEFVEHGITGLVADPLDVSVLSLAVESLLESSTLRRRLADAARASVRNFGWDRITKEYEEVYRESARGA